MFPYFELTLGFVVFVYIFETYLDYRQHEKLKVRKVPPQLVQIVDEKEFISSQEYGLDKSSFHFIHSAFDQILTILILVYGIYALFWKQSGYYMEYYAGLGPDYEITQSIIFVVLYTFIFQLIDIPWSVYKTFVLEEKHGFNKTTAATFVSDILKSLVLNFAIGIPFIVTFIRIIQWGGDNFYIYVWAFTFAFQIFLLTIFPIWIQPLFNVVEPLPEGSLRTKIEMLAEKTKFPLTKIYTIDGSTRSSHSNAYFYGFWKNKRIVLYDTLIKQASESEIIAILGHELGHYFKNHTLLNLLIIQVQMLVTFFLFGNMINNKDLYVSFGFFHSTPTVIGCMLFMMVYSPVLHVVGFLMNLLSRKFEFEADSFAVNLGYHDDLSKGLIKIHKENKSNLNPDHLYSTYHYSHPPLIERLQAMDSHSKSAHNKYH